MSFAIVIATTQGSLDVTERNQTEMISRRRVFSILGLAALTAALAPTVLTVSDAEAQQPSTTTPQNPQTGTKTTSETGTERRQGRRSARTQRRQERRTARTNRRQERRNARMERRHERRTARTERAKERTTGRAERSQQRHGKTPTNSSTPQ
jgi:hypothetical protein